MVLVEFILCMDEEGASWLKPEYGFSVGRNQHKSDHKIRKIIWVNPEFRKLISSRRSQRKPWLLSLLVEPHPLRSSWALLCLLMVPRSTWAMVSQSIFGAWVWAEQRGERSKFSSPPHQSFSPSLLLLLLQLLCWELRSRQDLPSFCCCPKSCFIFPTQPKMALIHLYFYYLFNILIIISFHNNLIFMIDIMVPVIIAAPEIHTRATPGSSNWDFIFWGGYFSLGQR